MLENAFKKVVIYSVAVIAVISLEYNINSSTANAEPVLMEAENDWDTIIRVVDDGIILRCRTGGNKACRA